jgi:hypothetical protein
MNPGRSGERQTIRVRNSSASSSASYGDFGGSEGVSAPSESVSLYQAVVELSRDPRYLPSKSATDLMFYVTHTGASLPASWSTDWVTLSPCGWRSVSCLIKNEALVLFATDSARAFLRGS